MVIEYEEGDVVMTINLVEFTKEFSTANGEETRDNSVDSETLIHVQGVISNDTVNRFEVAHPMAGVKFKLLYDNKHEFELTGATESPDGSTFDGSGVLPLEEQTFHLYKNIPLPVSETDKPLVLVIMDQDGEREIELR